MFLEIKQWSRIASINIEIARLAGGFRRGMKVWGIADALIIATAMKNNNAKIPTGDLHFKFYPGIIYVDDA